MTKDSWSLIIGGDICPGFRTELPFREARVPEIFGDTLPVLADAAYVVANLECPLITKKSPIEKTGPVLGAPAECVAGIAGAGIRAVTLANNHIMDHGTSGLLDTLQACKGAGIATFGAGLTLDEAARPMFHQVAGTNLGLVGFAEKEFSVASETRPGANPIEPLTMNRQVGNAKAACDFLVVFLHAGIEHYPYPSPRLQVLCRSLIDFGADVVVCQHSHCAGCYESYEGGLIVYGQGNFVFDWLPPRSESWNRGFLTRIRMSGRKMEGFEVLPYDQCLRDPQVTLMKDEDKQRFLKGLESRSAEIGDPQRLNTLWEDHCRDIAQDYYDLLLGNKIYFRARRKMLSALGIDPSPFTRYHMRLLGNLIRCETHREVLETIMRGADSRPMAQRRTLPDE